MATGDLRAKLDVDKKLLSLDQINDGLVEYLIKELGIVQVNEPRTISPLTADTANSFDIATPCKGRTRAEGRWLELPTSLANNIAFENTLGDAYYVALKYAAIPNQVEANVRLGGKIQYRYWKDYIGELAHPDAVVDLGGGQLQFTVNSVLESGVNHSGRTCEVWLDNPQSLSDAFKSGVTTYSSPNNKVTINSYLGQTTPSTDTDDYWVFIPGATVRKNTDLRFADYYLPLGIVFGKGTGNIPDTFDYSIQYQVSVQVEDISPPVPAGSDYEHFWGSYHRDLLTNKPTHTSNAVIWDGKLIFTMGKDNVTNNFQVWQWDGVGNFTVIGQWQGANYYSWHQCAGPIATFQGVLYAALTELVGANYETRLYKYNGTPLSWTLVHTFKIGVGGGSHNVGAMLEFGGYLHIAHFEDSTPPVYWQFLRWDGTVMSAPTSIVGAAADYDLIRTMVVHRGKIWFLANYNGTFSHYTWDPVSGYVGPSAFTTRFDIQDAKVVPPLAAPDLYVVGLVKTGTDDLEKNDVSGTWSRSNWLESATEDLYALLAGEFSLVWWAKKITITAGGTRYGIAIGTWDKSIQKGSTEFIFRDNFPVTNFSIYRGAALIRWSLNTMILLCTQDNAPPSGGHATIKMFKIHLPYPIG